MRTITPQGLGAPKLISFGAGHKSLLRHLAPQRPYVMTEATLKRQTSIEIGNNKLYHDVVLTENSITYQGFPTIVLIHFPFISQLPELIVCGPSQLRFDVREQLEDQSLLRLFVE